MSPLERIIREIIEAQGGISLAAYMELALQHPAHGYYRIANPIGRDGDFITAPEISQMFGEMLGVWCAETWRAMGKPAAFALVEFGAGRGTMMRDILRATSRVGGFHEAVNLYLVESSEVLRAAQRDILQDAHPHFISALTDIPPMPTLVVANEFFDALPVRQFEKTFQGWAERMVVVENDALVLAPRLLDAAEMNLVPPALHDATPNTIFEFCPKAQNIIHAIAQHIVKHHGAMLAVDYGYTATTGNATIQAVANHAYADIFSNIGETDLTAHVDFAALATAARLAGAETLPLVGQGEFLRNLGIKLRADALKKNAAPAQAAEIEIALHRLTSDAEMGVLFKMLEIKG